MSTVPDHLKYNEDEYYHRGMVKYTSRDYESIMEDFWEMVPKLTELWMPASDKITTTSYYTGEEEVWNPSANADPGVILGKFLASAADMLGVNLDWLANEIFAPTVSQRKNAEKLFSLIGYELGFYTAARTEVTFKNEGEYDQTFDFGFNGANFCTLNAYKDITDTDRIITYNILPLTNEYGGDDTRSKRQIVTENLDVFAEHDKVTLKPGEYVTRVAIEGELRSYSVSVQSVKDNNYIINIPSQHVDTTAIWIKAKNSRSADEYLSTQWIQVATPAEFSTPEPRFAVTYDSYSNARIQVSNYLNQLENYENNYLTVWWIDCSGVIGCVGEDVLQNYLQANYDASIDEYSGDFSIHNLSNTVELPNTSTITGRSPETAKEAYYNSRNYINTWDSLVTLPDYTRFLRREPGVDTGVVIDCQKALELNRQIYMDANLNDIEKSKKYIDNKDFPAGDPTVDWTRFLNLTRTTTRTTYTVQKGDTYESIAAKFDVSYDALIAFNHIIYVNIVTPGEVLKIPGDYDEYAAKMFVNNFKTYTAMCFAIHNDFKDSKWGLGQVSRVKIENKGAFYQYKPPEQFIYKVKRDYAPLQSMSVDIQFGYVRVFDFYIVGNLYLKKPVSQDVGDNIIATVKEALQMYFAPANRYIGQMPTTMEVVNVIQNADSRIAYFDAGSLNNPVIVWNNCDESYFNFISFARYRDLGTTATNIRIDPESYI